MSAKLIAPRLAHAASRRCIVNVLGRPTMIRSSSQAAAAHADVPVVSYHDGQMTAEQIPCHEPVMPAVQDLKLPAHSLKPSVLDQLPATMKRFALIGKIAVVTGGGRGLGFNMTQALAEVGVEGIAIMDVQQENGDQAAKEISSQTGVDVRFYKVDVTDKVAIFNAVDDIVDHFGRIDVLISAAGIADSNMPAESYDADKFRRLLDINITGTFLVSQACAQKMIASGNGGSQVFIASMSGSIVNYPQEQSCYNASKAAVIQLTKSLGAEWSRYGIRVNAISPGYMDTALNRVGSLEAQKKIWIDHTPQRRLGRVDELNNLAVYLASDASSFMTGTNCIIDGGYTLW